jgi:cell division protein FtsL
MGRIFNFVLMAVMIVGAVVSYGMKHKAELAADRVAKLQSGVAKEKNAIQLLRAEWSMLDQPARLQALVSRYSDYFQLQTFTPEQVSTIDEIPLRPIAPDPTTTAAKVVAGVATRTAVAAE